MIQKHETNLSGFWVGRYSYRTIGEDYVRYDVEITHSGGTLNGIITEPNTFDDHGGELLTATLVGTVIGRSVSFTKTYTGEGLANHTVDYVGTLDKDDTYISGTWSIDGGLSGPFEMMRDGPAVAIKFKEAKTDIDQDAEQVR